MGSLSYNARVWDLGPFRSLVPCSCSEDPYKDASYMVQTRTSSTYTYGEGPTIVEIRITCNCCGASTYHDVENWGVHESELDI